MSDETDVTPTDESQEPEEIEVVAHSEDEDEELNAGCFFNGKAAL